MRGRPRKTTTTAPAMAVIQAPVPAAKKRRPRLTAEEKALKEQVKANKKIEREQKKANKAQLRANKAQIKADKELAKELAKAQKPQKEKAKMD